MKEVTITLFEEDIEELERFRKDNIERCTKSEDTYTVKQFESASLDKLARVFLSVQLSERGRKK